MKSQAANARNASSSNTSGSGNAFALGGAAGGPVDSARISKELLLEIRRGDAAMADDLVALAPRSGRAFRAGAAASTRSGAGAGEAVNTTSGSAAMTTGASAAGGYSVSVNDTLTASDFVKQKREVGLVRMSLATKKAEIRKLDEKMDRAEKRLRQQQEQLTNTQEKFNNFLKFSNLEQDAAVRKADDETRAKHAKTIEVKKLSALINHAELETRKTRLQIDNCVAYKEFLESLAKSQWFYDVLIRLRVEDKREEILLNAETLYQRRCEELAKKHAEHLAARQAMREQEEREKRRQSSIKRQSVAATALSVQQLQQHQQQPQGRAGAAAMGGGNGNARGSTSTVAPEEAEEVSLEQEKDALHDAMEEDALADIAKAEAAIRAEVTALSLPAVKSALHQNYDESRLPMCFASVDDLLEVFINVEEGNLFLIQNCQELEEELEGISLGFMEEKAEMNAMVSQRTAQLAVLEENIAEAREKLKALDDRIATLEPRNARNSAGQTSAGGDGTSSGAAGTSTSVGGPQAAAVAAQTAPNDLSPEELKVRIETSIGHMFQLLTVGDQVIKANINQANASNKKDAAAADGVSGSPRSASPTASGHAAKAPRKTVDGATLKESVRAKKSVTGGPGSPSSPLSKSVTQTGKTSTSMKKTKSAAGMSALQQQQHQRDASMGPVEMLTIVENKLEEYHRYLTDPANHVEVTLIQSVMKQSDKQRRRQARLVHLASQEQEQEERIRRALERSQAPIAHRTGKQVRPRSHIQHAVDEKTQRKADRAAAAMEGSRTSIDSDEDGAEFFR